MLSSSGNASFKSRTARWGCTLSLCHSLTLSWSKLRLHNSNMLRKRRSSSAWISCGHTIAPGRKATRTRSTCTTRTVRWCSSARHATPAWWSSCSMPCVTTRKSKNTNSWCLPSKTRQSQQSKNWMRIFRRKQLTSTGRPKRERLTCANEWCAPGLAHTSLTGGSRRRWRITESTYN